MDGINMTKKEQIKIIRFIEYLNAVFGGLENICLYPDEIDPKEIKEILKKCL